VIAVDGPAASGKGTIARAVAAHFGLPHMDTGALYRAVGAAALATGVPLDDAAALTRLAAMVDPARLADASLRSAAAADAASRASAHPEVRNQLLALQRDFASRPGGAVLDGRDIGTVIAPAARAKLFVTARPEVRAARRHSELAAGGATFEAVLADIRARDARDAERSVAPLRAAADADLLDTSDLDIGAAVRQAIRLVERRAA
jgi:cytidylate kinase